MSVSALADAIDVLLPQTQCTKCGYGGCMPYARAIASGEADINCCPPGGEALIAKLAALLGQRAKPLNPANGVEQGRRVAFVDETRCIGCTLCIQACPVDAIVGAAKRMHTIIAELCTGCDLCIPPCPVECITMLPLPPARARWTRAMADAARARFRFRSVRLERDESERVRRLACKVRAKPGRPDAKKAVILAAIERARARRTGVGAKLPPPVRADTAAIDARRATPKKR